MCCVVFFMIGLPVLPSKTTEMLFRFRAPAAQVPEQQCTSLAASCTHRFARSTFQRFSYAASRLRKFSVAVWRGSEGIGGFLSCHVETPGNQWTGAQFGGASLAHARTRKHCKHAHLFKGFSRKNSGPVYILKSSCGSFLQGPIEGLTN